MNNNFKTGIYNFNTQSNFNFQLNRLVMWDGGDVEEVKKVGPNIKTSEDWKRELIALGDKPWWNKMENRWLITEMMIFFIRWLAIKEILCK